MDVPGRARGASGHLLIFYGQMLGPLLGGYLLLDKAFAYIHVPGTPLFVGELTLAIGGLGVLAATGYLRIPVRDEPILALLAAFFLWGFIRFLPGLRTYGHRGGARFRPVLLHPLRVLYRRGAGESPGPR